MSPSLVLNAITRAVIHTVAIFSLYLLFAGHNAPGGGFVGGLVGGAALVLVYAGGGPVAVREAVRVRAHVLLGAGLLLAGLTGVAGYLGGGAFLESTYLAPELPLLGTVALTTVLAFDTGVYLVVVGLVLGLLTSLGGEEPAEESVEEPS